MLSIKHCILIALFGCVPCCGEGSFLGQHALTMWSGRQLIDRFDPSIENKAFPKSGTAEDGGGFYMDFGGDIVCTEYLAFPSVVKNWESASDFIVGSILQRKLPAGMNIEEPGEIQFIRGSGGGEKDTVIRCFINGSKTGDEIFYAILDKGYLVFRIKPKEAGYALFFRHKGLIYSTLGFVMFHHSLPYRWF